MHLLTGNMQLKAAGEIRIPFGLGIAGYVAQTKEIVNLADAYLVSGYATVNTYMS